MMRCAICKRPLIRCAVPGLQIGPTCAKNRGLTPDKPTRVRKVEDAGRHVDPKQVDWINFINSTQDAESLTT